ncbi:hypothetical protein [Salicola sp. Rm-C-2C1-2]
MAEQRFPLVDGDQQRADHRGELKRAPRGTVGDGEHQGSPTLTGQPL